MKSFNSYGTKFFSSVVLSSTILNSFSAVSICAMQKSEENIGQNFLETDMFEFLLKKVTDDEIRDIENKWDWDYFEPDNCEEYLKNKLLVTLVKIYVFAKRKLEEFKLFEDKSKILLEKLKSISKDENPPFSSFKFNDDDIKNVRYKWNWRNFDPNTCDSYLRQMLPPKLAKIYYFAEIDNERFGLFRNKTESLLNSLSKMFKNSKLMKEKIILYFSSLTESNINLDGSMTEELQSYLDSFAKYSKNGPYKFGDILKNNLGTEVLSNSLLLNFPDDLGIFRRLIILTKLSQVFDIINELHRVRVQNPTHIYVTNDEGFKLDTLTEMIRFGPVIFDLSEKFKNTKEFLNFSLIDRFMYALEFACKTFSDVNFQNRNFSAQKVAKIVYECLKESRGHSYKPKAFSVMLKIFSKDFLKIRWLLSGCKENVTSLSDLAQISMLNFNIENFLSGYNTTLNSLLKDTF